MLDSGSVAAAVRACDRRTEGYMASHGRAVFTVPLHISVFLRYICMSKYKCVAHKFQRNEKGVELSYDSTTSKSLVSS